MENKKYDKDEALAKIKTKISIFYERVGREEEEPDVERGELIDDIEDILNNTEISAKHLVIEKLQQDEEYQKFRTK